MNTSLSEGSDRTRHQNTPGPGLVNQALLIREVMPRLYRGTIGEVLGELFQNSQRAGAGNVAITVLGPGRITYCDDGDGLDGVNGLFNLLCIANSNYLDESVEPNQRPLGLGFWALLVHERVRSVRVESNTVAFSLDTRRWLEDEDYQSNWVERVEKRPFDGTPGFSLLVEGEVVLTDDMVKQLRLPNPKPYDYWGQRQTFGPARGYDGRLTITLDGEPVETSLPAWFVLPRAEIVDTYLGNPIRISLSTSDVVSPQPPEFALEYSSTYVSPDGDSAGFRLLWYGQPLSDKGIFGLRIFLDVRRGAPLTAQAPTRAALVQDEKLEALYTWVRDRVFRFVCEEVEAATVEQVELLYWLDFARAESECPWVLLRPRRGIAPQLADASQHGGVQSHSDLEALTVGHTRALRKHALDSLLILGDEVVLLLPGTHPVFKDPATGKLPEDATSDPRPFTFSYGVVSFLAMAGLQAYRPERGAEANGVLWWKPGVPENEYYTSDVGYWGIGVGDEPPQEWNPVPGGSLLYVHDEIVSWDFDEARFFCGVASQQDLITFLQCYARWLWNEDEEREGSDEYFEESVGDLIRKLMGDTIARQVLDRLVWALTPFTGAGASITSVDLLREHGGILTGVRVRLGSGEDKELGLY
jgi:hypothetical protein